ncbi:UNVERIFIED_CONTAM: hypothetical protein HDU68_007424 [Siphonaria sp. JEL0065]|nr:hypothetical protein HDU68_007424 [Siphonaria sp. JEL0065]
MHFEKLFAFAFNLSVVLAAPVPQQTIIVNSNAVNANGGVSTGNNGQGINQNSATVVAQLANLARQVNTIVNAALGIAANAAIAAGNANNNGIVGNDPNVNQNANQNTTQNVNQNANKAAPGAVGNTTKKPAPAGGNAKNTVAIPSAAGSDNVTGNTNANGNANSTGSGPYPTDAANGASDTAGDAPVAVDAGVAN